MALAIPRQALPDPPAWAEFSLDSLKGGNLAIDTKAATVQILFGGQGSQHETAPTTLPAGNYQAAGTGDGQPLIGLRAQNATAGSISYLAAYFWGIADPSLTFTGTATGPGGPVLIVPTFTLATWPPPTPTAGQSVFLDLPAATYNPMGGLDVRWLCSYDAIGARWNVTGPPLTAYVGALEGRNNNAYGDLATPGPAMTCPLHGDYLIEVSGFLDSVGTPESMYMSYTVGGAASDGWAVEVDAVGPNQGRLARPMMHSNVPALTVVEAKYRNAGAAGANYAERLLTITPLTFR